MFEPRLQQRLALVVREGLRGNHLLFATRDLTDALEALIGAAFRGIGTDIEPIKKTVQFAEAITSSNPPQRTVGWLLCSEYQAHLAQLRGWLNDASLCSESFRELASDLAGISGATVWSESLSTSWKPTQILAGRALAAREGLPQWNH